MVKERYWWYRGYDYDDNDDDDNGGDNYVKYEMPTMKS